MKIKRSIIEQLFMELRLVTLLKILVRGWKQFSEHQVEMNQKLLQAR